LAILQDGYFKINTPLGPRYTKGGRFRLNDNGLLVDHNFNPIASSGGDVISIPPSAKVDVDPSGAVYADGELVGQIGVFSFTNEKLLQPVGGGLYKAFGAEIILGEVKIISGAYEESNVSGVAEMQTLLNIQRYSEMINNIINISEKMEENAIKTLANIAKQQ
jgi:flagellar basal-body rod protein FlgF